MIGREVYCFFNSIQEYLFPLFCLSCKKEGAWVCNECFLRRIDISGVFYCPVCHSVSPDGVACIACRDISSLSRHVALMPYQEGVLVAELLHTLKYNFAESVVPVFGHCITLFLTEQKHVLDGVDVIVPIPLHARRFAERGFNQAEKIAASLSHHAAIPMSNNIVRSRKTLQQALLSKEEREKNVQDVFVAKQSFTGKTVLLVDDVYTTGSTMQACAKALLLAGAREVRGFSIARG